MSLAMMTFINWYLYIVLLIPKELYVSPSVSVLKKNLVCILEEN